MNIHTGTLLYDAGKFQGGKKTGPWNYYDEKGKLTRTKTF